MSTTERGTAIGCDDCADSPGWRQVSEKPRLVEPCACRGRARGTAAPGVPLEFRDARLENYREQRCNQTAVAEARRFLAADAGDLFLIGGTGGGKTRLAATLLNELHSLGKRTLFCRVPKMLLDLQRTWSGADTERAEASSLIDQLYAVDVLVLDDVGVEKGSDYTRRTLYTVYEERGDHGRRTIWTSNLGLAPDPRYARDPARRPPTLSEFLDDPRLPSRIAGRAAVVFIGCGDQRIQPRMLGGRDAD